MTESRTAMADMAVFPRALLKKFISLYKDLPCLWDRNCPAYKMKLKRHEAISKLTELLQQHFPRATRVHVLRKIESLRACVRREYKRVISSREKATSPDEAYTPQLWYYEMCSFVFGEDGSNYQGRRASGDRVAESSEEASEYMNDEDDEPFEQALQSSPADYKVSTSVGDVDNALPAHKRFSSHDDDASISKRQCTEVQDEYDAIGVNVAAKLRSLPPNMRILAEKLINDVLFQAQMNCLSSATTIATPDPFKQDV